MKLRINNKKNPVEITHIVFKEGGALITQANGDKDLYTYSWLAKQEADVE